MKLDLRPHVQQAWEKVLAWNEADTIYRPEFNELKERLSRAYDDGASSVSRVAVRPDLPRGPDGSPRAGFYYDLIFRIPPLITLPKSKVPAALARQKPAADELIVHNWWMQYFAVWMPIAQKLVAMKAKAIAGRRPSEKQVEREKLRAMPANQAGWALIAARIAEVTREWRGEEIERVAAYFRNLLETYKAGKSEGEKPQHFWRRKLKCSDADRPTEPYSAAHAKHDEYSERCAQALDNARNTEACLNDPDYPRKAGEMHADGVIQNFTAKMQEKLTFAVPLLDTIEAQRIAGVQHTLSCTLNVKLTTGAKFKVRNSIVGTWSPRGTHFYRFPSTFHEIELPGHAGAIAMASEEEMNALFAPGTTIPPAQADKAAEIAQHAIRRLKQ